MRRPSKKKATKAKKSAKAKRAIKTKPRSETTKKAVENWSPSKFALWNQRWGDSANTPTSILLRHPTAPFIGTVDAIDDIQMQGLGNAYLKAVMENPDIDPPINEGETRA